MRTLAAAVAGGAVWAACAASAWAGGGQRQVDAARAALARAWRAMPAPPITPYSGPFGGEARAFVGKLSHRSDDPRVRAAHKAFFDWKRQGTYDPSKDPRPINEAFERAVLEDWRRMGYNCAYKGNAFTFRSGRWLKKHGLLGAIDQTAWGVRGPAPMSHDGKEARRRPECCGSFFVKENYDDGVELLLRYVRNFGRADMLKVGRTYVTSSWDEVGMRTRRMIDYRPAAVVEYRRFLRDVWFADATPAADTNGDGRTYNAFTGERCAAWDDVRPPALSPRYYSAPQAGDEKWTRPAAFKLWLDFHRYFTFEFFRRINAEVTNRLGGGGRVECYPFPQAFILWPGANAHWGMSAYWNARLNPIVTVEHCWPDHPAMSLNYAVTDPLARRYGNIVMGWSWFYFGKEARDLYDGPYDHGRALARMMGRRVDGIHHWLYSPIYRGRDRRQRRQIAYWHNFLAHQYAPFLSRSQPLAAEVALLMPDYTGYFYRMFLYPKMDWAYTAQALQESQVPCAVVTEEQLEQEADALKGFKALYVVGSEWTTPTIRKRIRAFLAGGGVVFANVDSLSLDIPTGKRTDFLEKVFGVRIACKHKNSFLPSAQDAGEEAWAAQLSGGGKPFWLQGHNVHKPGVHAKLWKVVGGEAARDETLWRQLDAAMARMPKRVRGLEQRPLDMRRPPRIRYAEHVAPGGAVAWSEVDTARAVRGRPIAWFGREVCGVETERTVWLGTRPGMSLHAIAPRLSLSRTTEPCNPYVTRVPASYEAHRPYVEAIGYAARKAKVARPVTIARDGRVPCNLEVLCRADADGNLMAFVINHDATDATYQVKVDARLLARPAAGGAEAWDLLGERRIESDTDGAFALHVPAWRVAVFVIGRPDALRAVKAAQAALNARDLSVPDYFRKRPELNRGEWNTPVPPIGK